MNKAQKEVLKTSLNDEKRTIRELKQVYGQAKKDVEERIRELSTRTDMENIQSIIYQKKYQEALKKQLDDVLNKLNKGQFDTISDYLNVCYENGFIGNMYDLHHQGIPMVIPINQKNVIKALQTDTKLSAKKYKGNPLKGRLAEDVDKLKVSIRAELSRSVANGSSWNETAAKIAKGMNNPFDKAYRNALLIARTEGHRIQQSATLDAMNKAKEHGADILKQWDATLDGKTRDDHREADGQIRKLDEPFEVGGEEMDAPGIGGSARNVCNCRCCLLQRAKWAMDDEELKVLQNRAEFFCLNKDDSFNDFKKKYLKLPSNADTMKVGKILNEAVKSSDQHYTECINIFTKSSVEYIPVKKNSVSLSEEEIIKELAGADKTSGSCASVAMAYIGQRLGYNVHDFRGGNSMECFRDWDNLEHLVQMKGMKVLKAKGACSITVGNRLLKQVESGKEYYLCVGQHASIVRKNSEGKLQYLELQADYPSQDKYTGGWHDFDGNPKYTLNWRFGCTNTSSSWHEKLDFMIDIDESELDTEEVQSILGYINTEVGKEMKGSGGMIR